YRRRFPRPPQVKFSVKTLAPVTRTQLDGRWQGTCLVRMWDDLCKKECAAASKDAFPPLEIVLTLKFQIARPVEEKLQRPGWIHSLAITQCLVAQSRVPHFLFREVAQERGIDTGRLHDNWKSTSKYTITGGVYLCDFNRDGILDMLIT